MNPMAVMFDMDGLLLDTERVGLDTFLEARREFELNADDTIFLRCVGHSGEGSKRIIKDSLEGRIDFDSFMKRWREIRAQRMSQEVPIKDGAQTLVRHLAGLQLPMGVGTSTETSLAKTFLARAGLLDYFECVCGRDKVTNAKPNPEVYHKVAGILGFEASECVVFEDSEVGTTAAVASGALTVQVPDLVPPSEKLLTLGHVVATTLLEGAEQVGLWGKINS